MRRAFTYAAARQPTVRHRKSPGSAVDKPGRSLLRSLVPFRVRYRDLLHDHPELVRRVRFTYLANGGRRREGFVVLPRWYNAREHPPLPLVIAPHGRGISPQANLRLFGRTAGVRPVRRCRPGGTGATADPLLVGMAGSDRRSQSHARDRRTRGSRPSPRSPPDLRDREQHGRAGDPAARRPPPGPPRGSRGARLGHEHGGALPGLPAAPRREAPETPRAARDRRHAGAGAARLRRA